MVTTIMCAGDSITAGFVAVPGPLGTIGYRAHLLDLLAAEGFSTQFVGALTNGSFSQPQHEGRGTWSIAMIDAYLQAMLPVFRPDVLLLHIGTNDAVADDSASASAAIARLATLLTNAAAASTTTEILVSTLIPRNDKPAYTAAFNALLPGMVYARRQTGLTVRMVDVGTCVSSADLSDGIHPTTAGYTAMAEGWMLSVRGVVTRLGVAV